MSTNTMKYNVISYDPIPGHWLDCKRYEGWTGGCELGGGGEGPAGTSGLVEKRFQRQPSTINKILIDHTSNMKLFSARSFVYGLYWSCWLDASDFNCKGGIWYKFDIYLMIVQLTKSYTYVRIKSNNKIFCLYPRAYSITGLRPTGISTTDFF